MVEAKKQAPGATAEGAPAMPQPLQIAVQKGQINYNGEVKDVYITAADGKQMVFDKKEDATGAAKKAIDDFKA